MLGLLSVLPRTNCCTNCWVIAEWSGEAGPDGMQHLLGRAGGMPTVCVMTCVNMCWRIFRN
ncbi:hypothetical protein ADK47_18775 [Streptomyces rimosus subsp. rimosus]|nr:hypothetical protein ADK47_18775 [Streptomyces rimosus subsp. rimosus]